MTDFSGIGATVIFNVSNTGPQGSSGLPFTSLSNVTQSQALSAKQSGTLFSNAGATSEVDLSLPNPPAPPYPLSFSLLVEAGQTLALLAPVGTTIQNGSDTSSNGGSVSSNLVGNMLTVTLVSATLWVITSITGIWNLE